MLAYPIDLERDTNGTFLVTFPEVAEAVTFGKDESDALLRAVDALETVLGARIDDREESPCHRRLWGAHARSCQRSSRRRCCFTGQCARPVSARPISRGGSGGMARRSIACSI
jgi:predicted RNase H-like HicB family nuclease